MKILKCINCAKGIITRLSLIMGLGLSLNFHSYSNPTIPPPMILEIYFGSDGWSMEMLNQGYWDDNLDDVWLIGLYDAAHFKPGIAFAYGEVTVVTQDDFTDPSFIINQAGDWLTLWYRYDNSFHEIDYYGMPFGDIPDSLVNHNKVSAPVGEESIAYQRFNNHPYTDDGYWLVKDLPNTIGLGYWQVSKRAEFSGYVKDQNNEPLAGVNLCYCNPQYHYWTSPTVPELITDSNGYFHTDNMFCRYYFISFLYEEGKIGNTAIFIEPDSANYFEFKLDTLLTGIGEYKPATTSYSIYNIPNPLSNQTTFVVETSGYRQNQKGVIKIYSSEGYIVDILPIEISGERQELAYNITDKALASSVYYYSLEIGKEKKASGKMVVSR
jgi:hypothetical protein